MVKCYLLVVVAVAMIGDSWQYEAAGVGTGTGHGTGVNSGQSFGLTDDAATFQGQGSGVYDHQYGGSSDLRGQSNFGYGHGNHGWGGSYGNRPHGQNYGQGGFNHGQGSYKPGNHGNHGR